MNKNFRNFFFLYQTDVAGIRIQVRFLKSNGFQTSRESRNEFD